MRPSSIFWLMLSLLLAGCLGAPKPSVDSSQLDVFGIVFGSSTDYREINGHKGIDEPCLRGYERSFDELDISIGYGHDGTIRKLTSRNPQTSMFGARPGDPTGAAMDKVRNAGFIPDAIQYRFRKEGLMLTLLVDRADTVFGMTLEATTPP